MALINTIAERKELWNELVEISQAMVDPWLVQGDFNAVFEHNQRLNGRPVSNYEIKDFAEFIHDAHLIVPRSVGHWFSWHNNALLPGLIMGSLIVTGLIKDWPLYSNI
ncbi:unnamed protein product [Amaranthus hypochondriacus]